MANATPLADYTPSRLPGAALSESVFRWCLARLWSARCGSVRRYSDCISWPFTPVRWPKVRCQVEPESHWAV